MVETEKLEKILKIITYIDAFFIILISILRYVFPVDPFSLKDKIWTAYWIVFGILLIAANLKVKYVLDYFNFLSSFLGKGLFFLFMGTIMLGMPWFILTMGIINCVIGLAFIYYNQRFSNSNKDLPSSNSIDKQQNNINMNNNNNPQGMKSDEIVIDQ